MVVKLARNFNFCIFTADRDLGDRKSFDGIDGNKWIRVDGGNVFYSNPGWRRYVDIWRLVSDSSFSTIHINSFFCLGFSIVPVFFCWLRGDSHRIVLAPRGEFSIAALGYKSFKKKIFIIFSKVIGLHKHVTWHASSQYEANDIVRVCGSKSQIRVATDISLSAQSLNFKWRDASSPLRVVFLSRIVYVKNLSYAIRILNKVEIPISFDIYGPIEDEAYFDECMALVKKGGNPLVSVKYCGVANPSDVSNLFLNYDVLFLPTLGENFGHVIAEAFLAGLPVLISDQTLWRNLKELGIGWDLKLGNDHLFVDALSECNSFFGQDFIRIRSAIARWADLNIANSSSIEDHIKLFDRKVCDVSL